MPNWMAKSTASIPMCRRNQPISDLPPGRAS
jgi:hypothetical protein